jgi:hypothetical protein
MRKNRSWTRRRRWFAQSSSQSQLHRLMINSPTILIPCHVNGNHWVALVHRIIDGDTYFFYADDLNSNTTEYTIKNLIETTSDRTFYPPGSHRIKCHSITYRPHLNVCGPRMILALMVMGLHPSPNENILLPFMSGNLAQILKTWIASSITSGKVLIPNLISVTWDTTRQPPREAHSTPFNIIPWNIHLPRSRTPIQIP